MNQYRPVRSPPSSSQYGPIPSQSLPIPSQSLPVPPSPSQSIPVHPSLTSLWLPAPPTAAEAPQGLVGGGSDLALGKLGGTGSYWEATGRGLGSLGGNWSVTGLYWEGSPGSDPRRPPERTPGRAGRRRRGPVWTSMDQYGPIRTSIDQYGPVWTSMDQYRPV